MATAFVEEHDALRRLATRVASGASQDDIFALVCEEVCRHLDADLSNLARYVEGDNVAILAGYAVPGHRPVDAGRHFQLDPEAMGWHIRRTGKPRRIDYTRAGGDLAAQLRGEFGIRYSVAAPIVVDGEPWGYVTAGRCRDEPIPDDAEERIGEFTELVAMAVANAEARRHLAEMGEEQRALRRLATLVASGAPHDVVFGLVCEEMCRHLDADLSNLTRFLEGDTVEILSGYAVPGARAVDPGRRFDLGPDSMGWHIRRTGTTGRIDYTTQEGEFAAQFRRDYGMRYAIGAPIVVEGEPWGYVTAGRCRDEPIPDNAEERIGQFAELVAMAVANAEARERRAEIAQEQEALRRLATLVASGAPQEEVFGRVCEEVCRHLDADLSNLTRFEEGEDVLILAGYAVPGVRPVDPGRRFTLDPEAMGWRIRRSGRPARIDYTSVSGDLSAQFFRDYGMRYAVAAPIVVDGRPWGFVTAARCRDERIPPDAEERIGEFTDLVALAVANAEARDQLARSRARIVQAADEERRRLERNLHDGAQQRLVTLALDLKLAHRRLEQDPATAGSMLDEAAANLDQALEELRELARGIHPAVLTDRGLSAALEMLASRARLPVEILAVPDERLPEPVEVAVYYLVSEALTNAAKHAQAGLVEVTVRRAGDHVAVEVRDDGVGGAATGEGSGLRGLCDRVEALGGRLEVESPPGAGTTLTAAIPL